MDYLEIRELYHHGIKGQRWGIRRFQNEDGSLTAEGKQRYGVHEVTKYKNGIEIKSQQMTKEGKKLYKQDIKTDKYSNAEKQKLVDAAMSGAGKGALAGLFAGTTAALVSFHEKDTADDLVGSLLLSPMLSGPAALVGSIMGVIGGVSVAAVKNKNIDKAKQQIVNNK